jgi:hypothetical protein
LQLRQLVPHSSTSMTRWDFDEVSNLCFTIYLDLEFTVIRIRRFLMSGGTSIFWWLITTDIERTTSSALTVSHLMHPSMIPISDTTITHTHTHTTLNHSQWISQSLNYSITGNEFTQHLLAYTTVTIALKFSDDHTLTLTHNIHSHITQQSLPLTLILLPIFTRNAHLPQRCRGKRPNYHFRTRNYVLKRP